MELQHELAVLERLADDSLDGAAPPASGELWRRGERWHRQRRRGSAAIAVLGVALLSALSVVTVQSAAEPEPVVAPRSAPTLPDRVYDVSPWLPGGCRASRSWRHG